MQKVQSVDPTPRRALLRKYPLKPDTVLEGMLQPRPESHSAHSADSAPGSAPARAVWIFTIHSKTNPRGSETASRSAPGATAPVDSQGTYQPRGDPMTTPHPGRPAYPNPTRSATRGTAADHRRRTTTAPSPHRSATHRATPPRPAAPLSVARRGGRHDRAADRPCFFDKRIRVTRQSSFLHAIFLGRPPVGKLQRHSTG